MVRELKGYDFGWNKKEVRGLWAKRPSSFPHRTEVETGEAVGGDGPWRRRRLGVRRRPGVEGKGRGGQGDPIPLLTLGGGGLEGRLHGRGCATAEVSAAAALRVAGEEKVVVVARTGARGGAEPLL